MIPGETILSKPSSERKNPHYSEFKVLRTNAYYIGTTFLSCGQTDCADCGEYNEYGHGQREAGEELAPNSRETDYFKTKEEAEAALEEYKKTGNLPNQRY